MTFASKIGEIALLRKYLNIIASRRGDAYYCIQTAFVAPTKSCYNAWLLRLLCGTIHFLWKFSMNFR